MATDEHQDWVDRVLAQSTWEPSAGFTDRVLVQAMTTLPPRRIHTLSREGLLVAVTGVLGSLRARVEMSTWVLLQYRDLLWRSG
jgi:hypothetical protein